MADWRNEVLLEGDFYITAKKRDLFKVTLLPGGLYYSKISSVSTQYEEKVLQMSDVIGCHCSSSPVPSVSPSQVNNNIASFTVFAYPFRTKKFSGKKTRHRQTVTFEVTGCSTSEENKRMAHKWKNVINCLARGFQVKPCDTERCEAPPFGKLLVLVNPHSGPGKALQIFRDEVEPMLEEASITFKLIVTSYAGHAKDLMETMELADWAAVIIVSGDGLIHEVINGLMQRNDWTSAIKKPLGCLPGGSGNALSCSINYAAGEPVLINPVLHSTFVLIKHRVIPMDLVFVQTPSKRYFSFLSVTWGMVADIDYESEKFRNLGEARFTLGAIKRIVNLRAYSGKLSFLPVAEYIPKTAMTPKVLKKIRRFSLRSMSNSASSVDSIGSKSSKSSVVLTAARSLSGDPPSPAKMDSVGRAGLANGGGDTNFVVAEHNGIETESPSPVTAAQNVDNTGVGAGDVSLGRSPQNYTNNTLPSADLETSSSIEKNGSATQNVHQLHSTCISRATDMTDIVANGAISSSVQQSSQTISPTMLKHADFEEEILYAEKKDGEEVPTPFLPPLDQPVPDNWEVVQGKFVLVCAVYQTHLGSDMLAAPSARLADGVIHLMFVRDGISRNHLVNLFLTFSEGMHVDSPEVEFVPVLAFRLEPDRNGGNIMIDGERIDPVPVQGQVLPSLANIMAIQ